MSNFKQQIQLMPLELEGKYDVFGKISSRSFQIIFFRTLILAKLIIKIIQNKYFKQQLLLTRSKLGHKKIINRKSSTRSFQRHLICLLIPTGSIVFAIRKTSMKALALVLFNLGVSCQQGSAASSGRLPAGVGWQQGSAVSLFVFEPKMVCFLSWGSFFLGMNPSIPKYIAN